MKSSEKDQAFLDEVYRKARLLEFDKREAEKVERNSRRLSRQRNTKFAGIVFVAAVVFLLIRAGRMDQPLVLLLSLLLFGAGLLVEKTELAWRADNDK
ncbi:hypothetical protein [Paenibacillus ihuae]|uniref:hypothetical protein n=1 Tax=Paenibacillus ihuae TaxID=1232431 RepID=UPI0006D5939F|nr:hypothetical protein [Paenibacillus ihuae]